jgi:DNA-binding MarR family transcriptional regulator
MFATLSDPKPAHDTAAHYPIQESLGHLISLTHRELQPLLERRVRAYGLAYGTWFYLRALWVEDGVSQRVLADRVGASQPSTLAALRKLSDQGLVTILTDASDRRRQCVRLTAKGRALRGKLLPRVAEINAVALAGLTALEIAALRRMLARVQANAARENAQNRRGEKA